MATDVSAQRVPLGCVSEGTRLPFSSRHERKHSAGVDVLAQNLALVRSSQDEGFGFCFPPPSMVGMMLQQLEDCRARAVVIVSAEKGAWYSWLRPGAVPERLVAPAGNSGAFIGDHHIRGTIP